MVSITGVTDELTLLEAHVFAVFTATPNRCTAREALVELHIPHRSETVDWVFPVDVISGDGKTLSALHRPVGERGEVPDWDWLFDAWGKQPTKTGNKYPNRMDAIWPSGKPKQ